MAATFSFYGGENENINNLAGSGIGFYGAGGFGYSVLVGSYQGRTFITSADGATEAAELDNCKYNSTSGVIVGQTGSGILLIELPNYLATLNIRFENDDSITTANGKIYGYDRVNKNNNPSGITLKGAEIIHPDTVQNPNGSGDSLWVTLAGSGSYLTLADGPGLSGIYAGNAVSGTRHDWYVALSATPTSVGSKTFGIMVELEYL